MFSDSPQWIKTVLALSLQRADANRIYSNIEVEPKNYSFVNLLSFCLVF